MSDAKVVIRDDEGNVVFEKAIDPIQSEGQVVWEAGQEMNPTPNDIRFQVKNPDETVSNRMGAWPEITTGSTRTPVLALVTPWHVVKDTKNAKVTLKGRNFLSTSVAVFESEDMGEVIHLSSGFVNNNELSVTLPEEVTARLIVGTIRVLNNGVESEEHILKVVSKALPDAPVLESIEPTQLNSSSSPEDAWITIHGSKFLQGDTIVKTDAIPSELETEFVSENTLRVLVPAVWMSGPSRIHLHAESLSDENLVSQMATLEVLNTIGLNLPPMAPMLSGVNGSQDMTNSYVALAPSPDSPSQTVRITGEGFLPGAKVVAVVNGKEYELETEFINSRELGATVPAELFSRRDFSVAAVVAAAAGTGPVQRRVLTQQTQVTFHRHGEVSVENDLSYSFPHGHGYGFHYKLINIGGAC